jgi:hypothetical protein
LLALHHQTKGLMRLKKIGRERDFNSLPFNSITAGVEKIFLQSAIWRVNRCTARVIPYMQAPLIQRQAQDAGLLGVTQRRGGKHDKSL